MCNGTAYYWWTSRFFLHKNILSPTAGKYWFSIVNTRAVLLLNWAWFLDCIPISSYLIPIPISSNRLRFWIQVLCKKLSDGWKPIIQPRIVGTLGYIWGPKEDKWELVFELIPLCHTAIWSPVCLPNFLSSHNPLLTYGPHLSKVLTSLSQSGPLVTKSVPTTNCHKKCSHQPQMSHPTMSHCHTLEKALAN